MTKTETLEKIATVAARRLRTPGWFRTREQQARYAEILWAIVDLGRANARNQSTMDRLAVLDGLAARHWGVATR